MYKLHHSMRWLLLAELLLGTGAPITVPSHLHFSLLLQAIKWMRENDKHMVLDADGLYIVTKNLDLVKGYKNCILTPNKNEFARLAKELDVNLEDKDRFVACSCLLLGHLQTLSCSFQCKPHTMDYSGQGNCAGLCADSLVISVCFLLLSVCSVSWPFLLAACNLQKPGSCTYGIT